MAKFFHSSGMFDDDKLSENPLGGNGLVDGRCGGGGGVVLDILTRVTQPTLDDKKTTEQYLYSPQLARWFFLVCRFF